MMSTSGMPDFLIDTILGMKRKPDVEERNKDASPLRDTSDTRMIEKQGCNEPPAWLLCTRYSDRPCSGPRTRKKRLPTSRIKDHKRVVFTSEQTKTLEDEFRESCYLTECRRKHLSAALNLKESQIKVWFQNKRAKVKKLSEKTNCLADRLKAQGLYNHSGKHC